MSEAIVRDVLAFPVAGEVEEADEDLMLAFAGGRVDAFEVLVRRHRRNVFLFAYHLLNNREEAEDIVQEAFIRVVKSRVRYRATARFTTWLYRIVRNLCIDVQRRRSYRNECSLDSDSGDDEGPHREPADPESVEEGAARAWLLCRELEETVARFVRDLPEQQREVFLMRQDLGLKFHEIGRIVGCPKNTAKSRMRYALEFLRLRLAEKGIGREVLR